MPATRTPERPWYSDLSIDLFVKILNRSIFHPFVASLIPLCLRAVEVPYSAASFQYSVYYAIFICILHVLAPISERIAYGPSRKVDLEDEIIVITGGASGLGRCIAEIYALRGATVAVLDIRGKESANAIEDVSYYRCDVGDAAAVADVWAQITTELGLPTILINNAGIVHGKRTLDLSAEDVERTFRINTMSHYHLNSLFLPPLLSRPEGGTIVTVSSVLGKLGATRLSAYAASKAALLTYHASITAELSESHPNIKTILVAPGHLSTELFAGLRKNPMQAFLGPVVEVQDLAMKIVNMIDAGNGGIIAEPFYARWIFLLEAFPVGLQKVLRGLAGVDTAMSDFQGKGSTVHSEVRAEQHDPKRNIRVDNT
ncbi:hypothetical protein MMC26_003962 [Xylographa opegraphella]|nr:hypothetical protein [Xylographa opegraphella]